VAYSAASDVKTILQIAADELTLDAEIGACIVSADALIDGLLKREGLSVPDPVPQNIADASAYFSAWMVLWCSMEDRKACSIDRDRN